MSYLCNRCSGWVHSKCSGLQNAAEYRRIKDWVCSSCNSPPTLPKLQPPPLPTQAVDENSFTIMQFNANGIGNKLTELGEFLKRHNVKVVVIQESKLSSNSKTPSIQNFTTVRKDRRQGQGGGLLTLIHKSINFSRKPESPETLVEPHLEELTITAMLGDHLPILISLQMDHTINPIPHRISFNLKKANWDRYSREIEDKLSKRRLPSNCQKGEKILRTIILKAASRHIPSG